MPFVADRVFGWKPVEITDEWGLTTISRGMAYALCNSLQCRDCGHLFLDVRFSDSEMSKLYAGYRDEDYTRLREEYEPGYTERNTGLKAELDYLALIEGFLLPFLPLRPAVLDWGGDTGNNTPFKNSCSIHDVYEISDKELIPTAKRVTREEAQNKHYDLVVCCNVLEHTPYPRDLVLEIRKSMTKDTVLYVEVPHEALIRTAPALKGLHEKKKHWHEHINFYTRTSLSLLIQSCDLEILAMKELSTTNKGMPDNLYQVACMVR
jgi:hypothetical protein